MQNQTSDTKTMTNEEAREIFNAVIANATDDDQIAKLELLREYFTNPDFRQAMVDEVYEASEDAADSDEYGSPWDCPECGENTMANGGHCIHGHWQEDAETGDLRWFSTKCAAEGHKWVEYATAESGYTDCTCERCGAHTSYNITG